ncbi:MAG: ABC transporter permease subunit, partial [Paracoccaceae bacterium]
TEVQEAGQMAGCTNHQIMWKVLVPSATPTLMLGVNQVIMLSLNMVIIASMIGAGGLGYDVLASLRRLDIGGGIEAGLAIVFMAIALDRASQAFATRKYQFAPTGNILQRYPLSSTVLIVSILTFILGLQVPAIQKYPEAWTITTGPFWANMMKWINVTFFDTFEMIKVIILEWLLLPVKGFFNGIPWAWGIIMMGLIAWRIGGWKLGGMATLMMAFIAANGLWAKAMVTIYLCSVSVLIATIIGIPLGIWAAEKPRAGRIILGIMDTLQTLPSFVYLIPVIMLFRVGDFSAMIAVILYALAPAVRYAAHGLSDVPSELVEAGLMAGCTRGQILRRIKLPLATPHLLLGVNQTTMLALSMLVITALVGTRDLGQEVYIALTKANAGAGVVAGLSVAFIAIISDRIVNSLAVKQSKRLGV